MKHIKLKILIAFAMMTLGLCGCGEKQLAPVVTESKLSVIFDTPSTKYNDELSKCAVQISFDAEDMNSSDKLRQTLESSDYNVHGFVSEGYGFTVFGGGAYAIGHTRLKHDGQVYTIVVITGRGTQSFGEVLGDWLKGGENDLAGHKVFHNAYDYEEKIWSGLKSYFQTYPDILKQDNVKILITGHSLGGAAANALAAKIDYEIEHNKTWSSFVSKDDVYCYTYGAIKVLSTGGNAANGYENIHNVYNYYDSYGPHGNKSTYNVSSPEAKFGHTELYYKDGLGSSDNDLVNHMNYYEAVMNYDYDSFETCSFISGGTGTIAASEPKLDEVDPNFHEVTDDSEFPDTEESDEVTATPKETEVQVPKPAPETTSVYIRPGTYVSTDGFNQHFTFYEGNYVELSALGINSEGTYQISGGRIIIDYEIFGSKARWAPSFSQDGDDLIIAETRFIPQ